jgi:hypothetical protein
MRRSTTAVTVLTRVDHAHDTTRAVLRLARTNRRKGRSAVLQGDQGRERLRNQRFSMACTTKGQNPEDNQTDAGTSGGSEREWGSGARHEWPPLCLLSND